MKLHWGKGITIFIISFMGFIGFMVYKATTTHSDLVATDYYQQEIDFQTQIDAAKNTAALAEKPIFSLQEDAIILTLPNTENTPIEGTVTFYRNENAQLDIIEKLQLTEDRQIFSTQSMIPGVYHVKMHWIQNNTPYFFETQITLPL